MNKAIITNLKKQLELMKEHKKEARSPQTIKELDNQIAITKLRLEQLEK